MSIERERESISLLLAELRAFGLSQAEVEWVLKQAVRQSGVRPMSVPDVLVQVRARVLRGGDWRELLFSCEVKCDDCADSDHHWMAGTPDEETNAGDGLLEALGHALGLPWHAVPVMVCKHCPAWREEGPEDEEVSDAD